jgi:hypothetical protein
MFLLDLRDIVGGIDPFFNEAARGTEIPRYLDGTEVGYPVRNVVSSAMGTRLARNSNDIGGLAL